MKRTTVTQDAMQTTGQNLIRIVIASYFMAAALGLISGTHATPLFAHWLAPDLARSVGGAVSFLISFTLLCGFAIRATALVMAMVVFWSSFIAAYGPAPTAGVDQFWRDLALISALMLTYLSRDRLSRRRSAVLRRTPKVRKIEVGARVTPRRVIAKAANSPLPRRARLEVVEPTVARRLDALKADAETDAPLSQSQVLKLRLKFQEEEAGEDVTNIFSVDEAAA
ncbi:hypothetical protein OG2516_02753 [Oceanicola granulosus HTCC2516]|uniref:Uncharacterized protein n=1 Tax=Oceanicola granulosus (strain ATCC BAA-861 / DSM 15982 / KCTC 12143 / HTCC2516) TaxID=314256 RepID=Q2CCL3_OCEGH|nr:hypothetical protein [Oceanicola granulosus]EAR50400.1 hypothetical protein OG2516_02753 [Oceanicola granulosus HTCC2516]